ncbi:MAG: hypothetical protein ACP5M9_00420 [Candidatus Micrarchaeia archaeon]
MKSEELIIDTSSILFGLKYKNNVFEIISNNDKYFSHTIVISKGVLLELKRFSKSSKSLKKEAVMALEIVKDTVNKKRLIINKSESYVDKWILNYATKNKAQVCTNDIKLKKQLKHNGITVISISKSGILR